MQKDYNYTGFCPAKSKTLTIPITYVFNFDAWEKGTGKCPYASSCTVDCTLIRSAPDKLNNL